MSELLNQISDGLDVNIQDQTSPTLIVPLNRVEQTTTVATLGVLNASTIVVTDATGFSDGKFIVIASVDDNRYYTGYQVGAASGTTITLDTPLDFPYPVGAQITTGITDMVVDGSSASQVFSLRASDPGLPLEVDVTRIIITCTCDSAVSLAKFANITALTKGIVLRRTDGTYNNIFNIKSNGDLANIAYDWTPYRATAPEQNVDGFVCRLTFGGQSKIGVVIRVGEDEDLEAVIQDDMTTGSPDILTLQIIAEGHVVVD